MRIVEEIYHPRMKVTIFKMNDKLSLKFEKKMLEQIFKFREGSPLHNLENLRAACTKELFLKTEEMFNEMLKTREFATMQMLDNENLFDEII